VATTKGGKHSCRAVKYRSTLSRAAGLDVGKCGEKRGNSKEAKGGGCFIRLTFKLEGVEGGKLRPRKRAKRFQRVNENEMKSQRNYE